MWALIRVILAVCSLLFPAASAMTEALHEALASVVATLEAPAAEAPAPDASAENDESAEHVQVGRR